MNIYPYVNEKGRRRWRFDKKVQGQRIREQGFGTRKECRKALDERLKITPKTDSGFMRLCEEYGKYAQTHFVRKTWKYKVATIRNFLGHYKSEEWPEPLYLQRYLDARAKRTSANAYNADRKDLHAMFAWGVRYGLATYNPLSKVPKMGWRKAVRYIPPIEHINLVLLCAGKYRDLLETVLYTLGRKSEILKLVWEDIDFEQNTIRLWTRKRKDGSSEWDDLPMPAPLCEILKRRLHSIHGEKERQHIFINARTGNRFSHLSGVMHRLCKKANVKLFGFHAFRHYGASYLIRRGTDLKTVQLWLRHRNIETTQRYIHEMPDSVRQAADTLGDMVGNSVGNKVEKIDKYAKYDTNGKNRVTENV